MGILKDTIREFLDDECPRMAAALSYYTVFSLPALLILVMFLAGIFVEAAAVRERVVEQVGILAGGEAAAQVGEMLRYAEAPGADNPLLLVLGIAGLLFAATAAFAQLQGALNRAWGVAPDPERSGARVFLIKRALSFLMILAVALLLLVSMLANSLIAAFGDLVAGFLPPPFSGLALRALGLTLTLAVATLLFGIVFHVLPDATFRWKGAWLGALATAVLFVLGNLIIGLWFSRGDPGSPFGAAGSLVLILVWVYYSAMIFLLGAELTQVLLCRYGPGIRPADGAVRVVVEKRPVAD